MEEMLKILRLEKGWSQEQLAELSGLSVRTIQRLENGSTCSLESAKALAAAFQTTPDTFLSTQATVLNDEQAEKLADIKKRQTIKRKLKFYRHLLLYLVVNTALAALNLLNNPDTLWFFYPMIGWGIGLASHAFSTFFSQLEKRLEERWLHHP